MENKGSAEMSGIVEMDETYLGGRKRGCGVKAGKAAKQVVIGIKQRGGNLRLFHAPNAKIETLAKYLKEHVSADVEYIMTDEFPAYPKALRLAGHDEMKHRTVNHSAEIYVDGNITTNGIESAFSLFKRSVIGSFHKISIKHLHRYLSEFETRFNARKADDRFNPTLRAMLGIEPMPYAELTAEE
jgi:transposase-like protein